MVMLRIDALASPLLVGKRLRQLFHRLLSPWPTGIGCTPYANAIPWTVRWLLIASSAVLAFELAAGSPPYPAHGVLPPHSCHPGPGICPSPGVPR